MNKLLKFLLGHHEPTLEQITIFAIENRACPAQLQPFLKFIETGDKLSAWQTVLGNVDWLRAMGLKIDQSYLEDKAHNVGKKWYPSGSLYSKSTWKQGKLHGSCNLFYPYYGNIREECFYLNNELDGTLKLWDEHKNLIATFIYKKGKLINKPL